MKLKVLLDARFFWNRESTLAIADAFFRAMVVCFLTCRAKMCDCLDFALNFSYSNLIVVQVQLLRSC